MNDDVMKNYRLSRRRFNIGLMSAVAAATVAGPSKLAFGEAKNLKGTGEVVVGHWGGIDGQAINTLLPMFSEETGIKAVGVEIGDADYGPKLLLAQQSGRPEWDIAIGMVVDHFTLADKPGMFAALDTSNWDPADLSAYKDANALGQNWVAGASLALWLLYGQDLDGNPPSSWADFFDIEKYPGNRGMSATGNGVIYNMIYALLADGVTPETLVPLDIPRALKKLDALKNNLVLWDGSVQGIQSLVAKDVVMDWAYGPSVFKALSAGQPVRLPLDSLQNGLKIAVEASRDGILEKGPNPGNAQIFMTWWKQQRIQVAYTTATKGGLAVPVPHIIEALPKELQDIVPFTPTHPGAFFFATNPWYSEINSESGKTNLETVLTAFNNWRLGG
jgi:spermidine/putrescine-binding protein